jgi:hypothetical protein
MAVPVWTLSVDLQTKTATFQTGLSDAAKAARYSFGEIKADAAAMSRSTSGSMGEARHGVMLLGEEFGVHLPRGLTTFIASLGPVGAAMEAAFPFLAIIVGATLLLEHLGKLKEAGEKLTASQANFGHTVANVLNALDNKLLEAGIRADELNNNHLGALHKQLELIDHQSLAELERSFDEVAKSADVTMAELKTSWYQFGAGSAGAIHALDDFKRKYETLLDNKDTDGAHNLLSGTLQTAQHILDLQKQAADNQTRTGTHGTHQGDYAKYEQAKNDLKRQGVGFTEKEIDAQETLVHALQAQANVEEKIAALKKVQDSNATKETQGKVDTDSDNAARQQADAARRELDEAEKLREEAYKRAVAGLQESEREKIEATRQGSTDRLAAIDASIKEENTKGLQETGYYQDLLRSRVELVRQMAEQEAKVTEEAAKESAEHTTAMERLRLASAEEADRHKLAMHQATAQQLVAEEVKSVNDATQLEIEGYNKELAALDRYAADYAVKKQALHDKIAEIEKQGQNKTKQIQDQAQQQQMAGVLRYLNQENSAFASAFGNVLMHKMTFSRAMQQLEQQLATESLKTLMSSLMKYAETAEMAKLPAAREAAAKAWASAPTPITGAILAAATFAKVMALESGGIVPGVGRGDTVPAMLTPGEAVLPKGLTEQLTNAAKFGDGGATPPVQVNHTHHYTIHAIDGASVKGMLEDHADTFHQHFEHHVRKMNH